MESGVYDAAPPTCRSPKMSFKTAATSSATAAAGAAAFDNFITEVKEIETRDSVLTSLDQINRLLRPGNSYFNLNPFEVLLVDPDITFEEMKKKYKRLSLLCHPDKNHDNRERAQEAFDILKKASEQVSDPDELQRCRNIIKEAIGRLHNTMVDKRKKLKMEKKDTHIDEDDPAKYKHALWVQTQKTWADKERKRRALETRANEEKARFAEEVTDMQQRRADEREWAKNFDESRDIRMDSWKNFKQMPGAPKPKKPKLHKTKKVGFFKPPKTKPESR